MTDFAAFAYYKGGSTSTRVTADGVINDTKIYVDVYRFSAYGLAGALKALREGTPLSKYDQMYRVWDTSFHSTSPVTPDISLQQNELVGGLCFSFTLPEAMQVLKNDDIKSGTLMWPKFAFARMPDYTQLKIGRAYKVFSEDEELTHNEYLNRWEATENDQQSEYDEAQAVGTYTVF